MLKTILHKWYLILAAISLAMIARLMVLYINWLPSQMQGCDPISVDRIWPCSRWGHSLSEMFPSYWIAYLGIAISLTAALSIAHEKPASDRVLLKLLWRIILANIALWYVFLPFIFDRNDWHSDLHALTILGGALVTIPSGSLVVLFWAYFPSFLSYPDWTDGVVFGWGSLSISFIHGLIVLVAYLQWYYLPPVIHRWWKNRSLA
jgi:hypothetical protein